MDDAYNIINNDHDAPEYNRHFNTQTPGLVVDDADSVVVW